MDDDFEKRIRLSELLLKERELENKERNSKEQQRMAVEAELQRQLNAQPTQGPTE